MRQNQKRQIYEKLEKKRPERGGATRRAKTKNTREQQQDNKR